MKSQMYTFQQFLGGITFQKNRASNLQRMKQKHSKGQLLATQTPGAARSEKRVKSALAASSCCFFGLLSFPATDACGGWHVFELHRVAFVFFTVRV